MFEPSRLHNVVCIAVVKSTWSESESKSEYDDINLSQRLSSLSP